MGSIKEKVAYLRGIIDGDSSLKEERIRFLFEQIMRVLEEIARDLDELFLGYEELDEYLQEIDFDLTDLEDDFYIEEDDNEEGQAYKGSDSSLIELECPQCEETIVFDKGLFFRERVRLQCPYCGALVFESNDAEDLFDEDDFDNDQDEDIFADED